MSVKCESALDGFWEEVKFKWTFGNETYSVSRGRVTIETDNKGHLGAVFTLRDVEMTDAKEVTCTAYYNDLDTLIGTDSTLIRVKGKYAALWPFLGILAEVFILCAIILVYEKKRNKAELDESDTDQSPDT